MNFEDESRFQNITRATVSQSILFTPKHNGGYIF